MRCGSMDIFGPAVRDDVVAASLTEIFYGMDGCGRCPCQGGIGRSANYLSGIFSGARDAGWIAVAARHSGSERIAGRLSETYRAKVRAITFDELLTTARKYLIPRICKLSLSATVPRSNRRPRSSANSKSSTRRVSASARRIFLVIALDI